MKFSLDRGEERYYIDTYQAGEYLSVNRQQYTHSLIVTQDSLQAWSPSDFNDLNADSFTQLLALNQGLILFGSGKTHQFPQPDLLSEFYQQGINIEIMSTDAACRTFNVLMSENRKVTAALLL